MEKNRDLSDERYLLFLERTRKLIEIGFTLVDIDCTNTGHKYTHCSWGSCSLDVAQWPDMEDHDYPKRRLLDGWRVWTKTNGSRQRCPMDTGPEDGINSRFGCFYRCRVFKPKLKTPTREEALELFDVEIARMKKIIQEDKTDEQGNSG